MNDLSLPSRELSSAEPPAMLDRPISTMPVEMMRQFLSHYHDRRAEFRLDLFRHMTEGLHYGTPPGCEPRKRPDGSPLTNPKQWMHKPSLYKAGADMICDILTVEPRFHLLTPAVSNPIIMSCDLICRGVAWFPGWVQGQVIANGHGAANGGESDRDINKTIKMAEKRAKVGAVIHMLGASDLFTQDIEDLPKREVPQADPSAPKVPTREERRKMAESGGMSAAAKPAEPGSPQVTSEMLKVAYNNWRRKFGKPSNTYGEFCDWAAKTCGFSKVLDAVSDWTVDAMDAVSEELKR